MPFSGGTYTAPASSGAFNQAITGQPATPEAWNILLADLSTALSTAILKDGQQTVTADIPMASHKFTGLSAGVAATDSATLAQAQSGVSRYATTVGGTANAITLIMTPVVTALAAGLTISFRPALSNTLTSPTVKVDGTIAKTVVWPDQRPLIAGDIPIGANVTVMYNATLDEWTLMSVGGPVTANMASTKGDVFIYNGSIPTVLARTPEGSVPVSVLSAATGRMQSTILYESIYGLTYQNSAGDVTNDIDFAAGGCMDATNAYPMTFAALTKQSDANWAVGTNAGMLDTGAIGNGDYYTWTIARSDTGVVDVLCSLSSTAPTMSGDLAPYDFKRLTGWFRRVGGAIVLFKTYEMEGGGLQFMWSSPTLDVNLTNTLTTTRRTDAVRVPLNFATNAILNIGITDAAAAAIVWCYCPDQADQAPGAAAANAPLGTISIAAAGIGYAQVEIRTSSAGLIAARASIATVDQYGVSTLGFKWSRRP